MTALVEGLREQWLYPKWYSCVTTPKRLKDIANESFTSKTQTHIIVTTVLDAQVLWVPVTDEYEELQWASFSVEYGRPSGRNNVVPWIKLDTTPPLIPPQSIPKVPDTITEKIRKLARIKHKNIPVKLLVGDNKELKVFEVDIDGDDIAEKIEFAKVRDLVRFLRHNLRSGMGYKLQGMFLIWGLDDIEFDTSVEFLKPLVHRSRFYPDEYFYPTTCMEFLSTTTGNEIVMLIHPDGTRYRVSFEDLPKDSTLRALETVSFDIYALGLLTDCPELYDPRTRRWYPVTLDVRNIMDIRFSKLHEYPRLQNALDHTDVSEFDWSKDSWRFSGHFHGNEINWRIVSTSTGQTWMNRSFTYVTPKGQNPKDGLDRFRRAVASIVPPSRLGGLEDWLEGLESTLRERDTSMSTDGPMTLEFP
ncbi:MAG: hypothetical protein P1Q69_12765 [Candidatus Thorarchaeota archaeon]|nr:hypothetical protein [Candidatus Thorarchaeota archaeon]